MCISIKSTTNSQLINRKTDKKTYNFFCLINWWIDDSKLNLIKKNRAFKKKTKLYKNFNELTFFFLIKNFTKILFILFSTNQQATTNNLTNWMSDKNLVTSKVSFWIYTRFFSPPLFTLFVIFVEWIRVLTEGDDFIC